MSAPHEPLATVFPHPLGLAQHKTLQRLFHFLLARARFEIELSVERVELKK